MIIDSNVFSRTEISEFCFKVLHYLWVLCLIEHSSSRSSRSFHTFIAFRQTCVVGVRMCINCLDDVTCLLVVRPYALRKSSSSARARLGPCALGRAPALSDGLADADGRQPRPRCETERARGRLPGRPPARWSTRTWFKPHIWLHIKKMGHFET